MRKRFGKHQRAAFTHLLATLFQAGGGRQCFGPKGGFLGIKVGEGGDEKLLPRAALRRLEDRGWYRDGAITPEGEVAYHEYLATKNASA